MKIRTLAVASAALTWLGLATGIEAMPPAGAWEIGPNIRGRNYSVGMPAQPSQGANGSVVMDFPVVGSGQVDALTTGVNSLEGARQITLRYRIDAARGARFIADETPGEPATVSVYLQQAGDNWSARGRYASYRWYAPPSGVIPLAPGEHTLNLRLDDRWTNVSGVPNSTMPQQYAKALANASTIGIAFGSSSRRSHGVFATAPSRFTLIALDFE
jgi:hypothetical protein